MPAGVEKSLDGARLIAEDEDWRRPDRKREIVAGIGNFALGTRENPSLVEDRLQVQGEDFPIRVKRSGQRE
jgi:hypothetical protein